MVDTLLFDTDILIQYLKDDYQAIEFLEHQNDRYSISVITVAELFAGVHTPEEEKIMNQFLRGFEIIPVNPNIARKGGLIRHQYMQSHGTGLADALIAATAEEINARLVSFNIRHYPMLDVLVPYDR